MVLNWNVHYIIKWINIWKICIAQRILLMSKSCMRKRSKVQDQLSTKSSLRCFDISVLTASKCHPALFLSPESYADEKASCFGTWESSSTQTLTLIWDRSSTSYLKTTRTGKASCLSLFSQTRRGSAWEPALLFPESVITWAVSTFFIPSWCTCGSIDPSSLTKCWVESWPQSCGATTDM